MPNKFALVRQHKPHLAHKTNGEIANIIRKEMGNELMQQLDRLENASASGLGWFASWLLGRRTASQNRADFELTIKERVILDRLQTRKAAQYGITVDMLNEFTRLKVHTEVSNWEADRHHERSKDMLSHTTSEQIRHEAAQASIQCQSFTHSTNETIRLEKHRAKIERQNKRNETFTDTFSHVVKAVIDVGAEIVKTHLQKQQLLNQIQYAAAAESIRNEFQDERTAAQIQQLNYVLKHSNDPVERKVAKARRDKLMRELGVESRPRKAPNRPNNRKAHANRDLRGSSRKRNQDSPRGGRKT